MVIGRIIMRNMYYNTFFALLLFGCGGLPEFPVPKDQGEPPTGQEAKHGEVKEFSGMSCPDPWFAIGVRSLSPARIRCAKVILPDN